MRFTYAPTDDGPDLATAEACQQIAIQVERLADGLSQGPQRQADPTAADALDGLLVATRYAEQQGHGEVAADAAALYQTLGERVGDDDD